MERRPIANNEMTFPHPFIVIGLKKIETEFII